MDSYASGKSDEWHEWNFGAQLPISAHIAEETSGGVPIPKLVTLISPGSGEFWYSCFADFARDCKKGKVPGYDKSANYIGEQKKKAPKKRCQVKDYFFRQNNDQDKGGKRKNLTHRAHHQTRSVTAQLGKKQ